MALTEKLKSNTISKRAALSANQIDFFEILEKGPCLQALPAERKLAALKPAMPTGSTSTMKSREGRRTSVVSAADMPNYSPDLIERVERTLAELPAERVLFTYRAIKECFGISRATVARRVKDGLVPGVKIANGRVLSEGPIRRFDRAQVRWLLLAVRDGRNIEFASRR